MGLFLSPFLFAFALGLHLRYNEEDFENYIGEKMSYFIYSTLATDTIYQDYDENNSDLPNPTNHVLIKGGAGVAGKNLVTPLGVVTVVDDAQMTLLQSNSVFQLHLKNGFITVRESEANIESVVADMVGRDNSAPLVPEDFEGEDGAKPQVIEKKKSSKK